jgi:hypothetical protein
MRRRRERWDRRRAVWRRTLMHFWKRGRSLPAAITSRPATCVILKYASRRLTSLAGSSSSDGESADGRIVVALCETEEERVSALQFAESGAVQGRSEILIAIPRPLRVLGRLVPAGPFQDFYARLLAKGMEPEMARLTLARKIAALTLTIWKKGARFDANQLNVQAA